MAISEEDSALHLILKKFCRISAALRQGLNGDSDLVGFLVVRNEHHGRDDPRLPLLFSRGQFLP